MGKPHRKANRRRKREEARAARARFERTMMVLEPIWENRTNAGAPAPLGWDDKAELRWWAHHAPDEAIEAAQRWWPKVMTLEPVSGGGEGG